jgi:hypothetical protein
MDANNMFGLFAILIAEAIEYKDDVISRSCAFQQVGTASWPAEKRRDRILIAGRGWRPVPLRRPGTIGLISEKGRF